VDYFAIDDRYAFKNVDYIDNSSNFYKGVFINTEIRYNFFHVDRNKEIENDIFESLLRCNNIQIGEEYDVICEFGPHIIRNEFKKRKTINIHHCTNNPIRLLKLFENATEIHLVENSHVLLLYYSSMSGLIKLRNVNIHIYARNRSESLYKMFLNPKIEDWNIIYE
jgi:hypothetical protein